MRNRMRTVMAGVVPIALLLLAGGCATQLAPDYDRDLVERLNSTNVALMEFFASTSPGLKQTSYGDRKETYDSLIGRLDALVIQARSRPIPQNSVTKKVNEALDKRGVQILDDGDTPSASALEKISETMVKMRDTDRQQGVTAFEVAAFKGQVSIYMDQAMTYENYLER